MGPSASPDMFKSLLNFMSQYGQQMGSMGNMGDIAAQLAGKQMGSMGNMGDIAAQLAGMNGNIDPGFNYTPGQNIDPGFFRPQGSLGADPGFNYIPGSLLGAGIGAAQGLQKPMVGQSVPGIPNQNRNPAQANLNQGMRAAQMGDFRNNWLQGNGQPRIPVVHDRTGASANTLSKGQRMRFDNIRNLYGGERAAEARANMLMHNARKMVPAVPTGEPDSGMLAAMRRIRAIEARPEIPRARRGRRK